MGPGTRLSTCSCPWLQRRLLRLSAPIVHPQCLAGRVIVSITQTPPLQPAQHLGISPVTAHVCPPSTKPDLPLPRAHHCMLSSQGRLSHSPAQPSYLRPTPVWTPGPRVWWLRGRCPLLYEDATLVRSCTVCLPRGLLIGASDFLTGLSDCQFFQGWYRTSAFLE